MTEDIESFKQFPEKFPKLTISKNKDDSLSEIKLLPDNNKTGNGICFNAKWNGINLRTIFDTGASKCYIYNRTIAEKMGIKFNTITEAEAQQARKATGSCNEASIESRYEYKCPQIDIKINNQVISLINDCSVAKDKENDDRLGTAEGDFLGNAVFKYCKKAIFDFDNMVFSVSN